MDKLKLHTPDFTKENIAKLAELFPNCVTESRDDKGNVKKAVDFDQLRQELSDHIVDGPRERYHLNWPGKRESLLVANAPIAKTLRPCREESVDFDTTENLFIEGDNLDALKLLQETYLNKVKMIYIDPPYNTGNDFVYDDDFKESSSEYFDRSNQTDESGNRLIANPESRGRFHSDWLSMILPRLRLARNLLKEDGVVFISIDDHEIANLYGLCEEVFGRQNIIGCITNRRRQVADNRNYSRLSTDHEYVLICGKGDARLNGVKKDLTKYSNEDNDPRGPWMSDNMTGLASEDERPNLHYNVVDPETQVSYPPHPNRGWAYEPKRMAQLIEEGRILWPAKPDGRPRIKRFLNDLKDLTTGFSTVQELGLTTDGTRETSSLMGYKAFDFPKPVKMLRTLIEQGTSPHTEDIVLDFFAGSGTTAQGLFEINASDNGNRQFVLVQLPEECAVDSQSTNKGFGSIADIAKERIRRAGKKIKDEHATTAPDLDIGFRVLKVDTSNMKDVYYTPDKVQQEELLGFADNIKPDRSEEDLLFQVLLDWGVDLTLPMTRETIEGKTVFFVDENALAACFGTEIDEALVKALAKRKPLRAVFRDAGFTDDSMKINVEQIFKLLSPETEVKSI